MRRIIIAVFGLLFVSQSSGAGAALAQGPFSSQQTLTVSVPAAQRYATNSRGAIAPPDFTEATKPHPHPNPDLHPRFIAPVIRAGGILLQPQMQQRIPANLPPDPRAMKKTDASTTRTTFKPLTAAFSTAPLVSVMKTGQHTSKPMTVGATGGNGATGENAWWPYVRGAVPGAGTWEVNAATGNLIVADSDVDIPERGLDLSYDRVYNSLSQHTFSNADNSVPDIYGEGWTSTADAHLGYSSNANTMTVWSGDGARYDYTSAGNGSWTPPAGMQGTKLEWDGGCGYYWKLKSGIVYYFNQNPYGCGGAPYAAYSGRLYRIYGRNQNNYIQFNYYWNTDASTINNLNHIVMQHSDGHSLTLQFGNYNGYIELASITRPDGVQITYGYDGSGDLTSVNLPTNNSLYNSHGFGYYSGYAHRMNYVTAPLWTQSSGQKGSYTWLDYNGSNISGVQLYGWGNFTPDDGTNLALQGTAPQAQQISYMSLSYPSGTETQVTDSDGHATNYFFDGAGRTTEEDDYAGNNNWLRSYTQWDAALNAPTESVAPNGGVTDYGYDQNGNAIWVQEPTVQTSLGQGRPVSRFSYDQYNNLVSYCDPQYVWTTGATSCPQTGAVTHYTWSADVSTDATEPYGRLTDIYTPLGYHTHISYDSNAGGGGDYGLPTNAQGDAAINQLDGNPRTPTASLTYDALGNITSANDGSGTSTYAYDTGTTRLNRMLVATDPDGYASYACYYDNGQIRYTETARQHAMDGSPACQSTAPPYADAYSYDADGNEITETHHFGQTGSNNQVAGVTQKWYDGADRLVEVALPHDGTDIFTHWLTRYIYDLSGNPNNQLYGNLASVQRYVPGPTQTDQTVTGAYAWTTEKSWTYDALDRVIQRHYFSPGATTMSTDIWTWDTNGAGLLGAFSNAAGDSTTFSYDALGEVVRRTFATANSLYTGSLPSEEFSYDPDGRLHSYNNDETGMSFTTYDADGNIASYSEPNAVASWTRPSALGTVGPITAPKTFNYTYYPDDVLEQIAETDGNYTQQYSYFNDGLLRWQNTTATWTYSGVTTTASYHYYQTFSPGGRIQTKSDAVANPCPAGNRCTMVSYPAPLQVGYDPYGDVSTWTIPAGTYSNFSYDAEGEPTGMSAGGQQFTLGYSTRGELLSVANGTGALQSFRSADGFMYGQLNYCTHDSFHDVDYCAVPKQTFDTRNGALISTQTLFRTNIWHTTTYGYDLAGRRSGREYDALNRLYKFGTAYSQGPGTLPENHNSVTYHSALGQTPLWATDQNGVVLDVKLGMNSDVLPNYPTYTGLTVYDRDPFGFVADARNNTGTSAWTFDLFSACDYSGNLAAATAGFVGTPLTNCNPSGNLYAYRTDGYYDGTTTFRGVRTYDADTQQWSTPDAYGGSIDDPISGLSYNYANNNPAVFADPSGFCGTVTFNFSSGDVAYHMKGVCPDIAFNNCEIGCYGGGPSAMSIDMLVNRLSRMLKNECAKDALRNGGIAVGIDVVALIPVVGGLSKVGKLAKLGGAARFIVRGVGHQFGYVGAVADKQGARLLPGLAGTSGAALGSAGVANGDKSQAVSVLLAIGGFIPGVGQGIAGIQLGIDIALTAKALHDCH